jgi:hypothetical protein
MYNSVVITPGYITGIITLRLIMRATIDTRGYMEFVAILTLKSLDDLSRNRCSAGGEDMHVLCRGREC